MISKIPVNVDKLSGEDLDKQILRAAIIAELDAINLYEEMSSMASSKDIKKILADVAKEEKTHIGELQALLLDKDSEYGRELIAGKKEVDDILK